ncbi:3-hydroxyacyl-CoA dehydrogenase NAD-binding domain-containing protein [Haliea sp. E1-2-M8]|uniref:3-hydroxyacyl-CoA dehydrogenase NAD-binding domain-containing protein n=1 Tax=Haliea sp. E1-2-M8 TaxID=3064706 RepID=UPI00271852C2|nr:3-hydroxyacyl-CoA dehydrogenase NAD-binding domain-containing protein [Haliea sp. E1-2-M8]MDO8861921.1 3-hydroxyacyl-CoA dehydrogenase NAD-binding domain-containing protein [Haliea sp. E1-2-M8]
MQDVSVHYELNNTLGIIRIDNPPVNALSQAVRAGIIEALEQARSDSSQMLLVLCAGRTFIAGADITEFGKTPQPPSLPDVIAALEGFPKPVVAALHGTALGGGLELAMACHYRAALPDTRLGLPEVKLGLLPGAGGTQRLPRLVGPELALEMISSGAPITANKALEAGLIDQILEGELEPAAIRWALTLLADSAPVRPTGERPVAAPADTDFLARHLKQNARKHRGQLAPGYIAELVELAQNASLEEGLKRERECFLACKNSPQSAALRHVFFAERATGKLPDIPADTPLRPIKRVAVIGAGTMGGGIAMCFASAGIPVILVETAQDYLDNGLDKIRQNYANSVKRGRFSAEAVAGWLDNISGTLDYADLAEVDLVIEAVFENMAVKKEVFGKLDAACKPGCILATNTSYLDVNAIAAATRRPADVIGAHFFSPANVMKLLEVVRAEKTAADVVQTFMKLARTIGKIPVAVGVCHGFVGNRMLRAYARQAQLLLLEGATPSQVDKAMENWGMAMGPLAVGDLAGLDIGYRSRRDQGIEPRSVLESALADTLVDMDRLGQKSGAGYYRYDPETRARQADPEVDKLLRDIADEWQVPQREIGDEEIVDRLILALVNEGAAILQEGIAARPSDVDIVYINGYGFPSWRGGPMFYADSLGLDTVVARLRELRELTGDDGWEPAPLLLELAAAGNSLASLNGRV